MVLSKGAIIAIGAAVLILIALGFFFSTDITGEAIRTPEYQVEEAKEVEGVFVEGQAYPSVVASSGCSGSGI